MAAKRIKYFRVLLVLLAGFVLTIPSIAGAQSDGSLKWLYAGDQSFGSPVLDPVGNEHFYVASSDGGLYAFDTADNSYLWSFFAQDGGSAVSIATTPAVGSNGWIYFGLANGSICALDPADRTAGKWTASTEAGAPIGVYVDSNAGLVYATSVWGQLFCFDMYTGEAAWASPYVPAGATLLTPPVPHPDGSVIVVATNNVMYKVGSDGAQQWYSHSPGLPLSGIPVVSDTGIIYCGFGSSSYKYITRYNPADGDDASYDASASLGALGNVSSAIVMSRDGGSIIFGTTVGYVVSLDATSLGSVWAASPSIGSSWVTSTPMESSNGIIYVGSVDTGLYAIDGLSGSILWTMPTVAGIASDILLGPSDNIYVPSVNNTIYVVDPVTEGIVGYIHAGGPIDSSPTIYSGDIFIGGPGNDFFALYSDGSPRWTVDLGAHVAATPAVGGGNVYAAANDGNLYLIDIETGVADAVPYVIGTNPTDPALVTQNNEVTAIYVGDADGTLQAFFPSGAPVNWSKTFTGPLTNTGIGYDKTVFVGDAAGNLHALNPDDGSEIWSGPFTTASGAAVTSAPVFWPGLTFDDAYKLYFGDAAGYLYAVSSSDGSAVWATPYDCGAAVATDPAIDSDGNIYVGDANGVIHAISSAGALLWTATPAAGEAVTAVSIDNTGRLYAGAADGTVHALALDDGAEDANWPYNAVSPVDTVPAVGASTLYFATRSGGVFAVNLTEGGGGDMPWPMSRHDNLNSGAFSLNEPGTLKWDFSFSRCDVAVTSAAVYNGNVYIAHEEVLYQINDQDGTLNRSTPVYGRVSMYPMVDTSRGTVYAMTEANYSYSYDYQFNDLSGGRQFYYGEYPHGASISPNGNIIDTAQDRIFPAYKAKTFESAWTQMVDRVQSQSAVLGDGTVYLVMDFNFTETDSRLYALDQDGDGLHAVSSKLGNAGAFGRSPAADPFGSMYVLVDNGASIVEISLGSGGEVWRFTPTGQGSINTSPVIDDDGNVFFGTTTGYVFGFDRYHNQLWDPILKQTGQLIQSCAVDSDSLYFITPDTVYCIDIETGATEWTYQTEEYLCGDLVVSPGTLYVPAKDILLALYTKNVPLPLSGWPMRGQNPQRTNCRISTTPPPPPSGAGNIAAITLLLLNE